MIQRHLHHPSPAGLPWPLMWWPVPRRASGLQWDLSSQTGQWVERNAHAMYLLPSAGPVPLLLFEMHVCRPTCSLREAVLFTAGEAT